MLKLKKIINRAAIPSLVLAAAAVTVLAAIWLANSLGDKRVSENCGSGPHAKWLLVIKNNEFQPHALVASRCDTLTVKNLDKRGRLMAFGEHYNHQPYDGIAERFLVKGESFTFTLTQTGTFRIHDHNQDSVQAGFTVR